MELHSTLSSIDWEKSKYFAEQHIRNAEKRIQVIASINAIKRILGENFLEVLKSQQSAYLGKFIFGPTWDADEIIGFSEKIDKYKSAPGFDNLLKKLLNPNDAGAFDEFLTIMETCALFSDNYDINFAPRISGFPKYPDIELMDRTTGDLIYVEVSESKDSNEDILIDAMMRSIVGFMHSENIVLSGKFKKILNGDSLDALLKDIKAKMQAHPGAPIKYTSKENDVIALVCDHASKGKAEQICRELDIEFEAICGPANKTDTWGRFRRKYKEEKKQLAEGLNNIVVIWASDAMLENQYGTTKMEEYIQKSLDRDEHISGIIAVSKYPNQSFDLKRAKSLETFSDKHGAVFYLYSKFREPNSVAARALNKFQTQPQ